MIKTTGQTGRFTKAKLRECPKQVVKELTTLT